MKKPYLLLSLTALFALGPVLRATTMIYPVAAIEDLWNLAADDFRQKYAGINASGLGPSDEGWYVRYRHENLTYLFGPLKEREEARTKKWDLEAVRDAAIRNRATIAGSQVDYVRFTYSGVFGKGGGNTPYRGKAGGKDGGDGEGDGEGGKDGSGTDGTGKDGNGKDGSGKDGTGDGAGGDGQGEKLAGLDGGDGGDGAGGEGGQKGGKGGKKGSKSGKSGGQSGDGGDGDDGDSGGQSGSSGKSGGQKVASNKSGSKSGSQGGQSGSGQQGSQSGQQGGQSGQQGGSSGGQSGQPGGSSGAPSSGGQGGGGNPLDLVVGLLRKILGL